MTDEQIVSLFFARSEEALKQLTRKCKALCMSISRSILGNEDDAEECFNDALLCVWNNVPPERPAHLTAYTAKIARNLSLNLLEKKKARKRGGGEYDLVYEELEGVLYDAPDPGDTFAEKEALKAALGSFLSDLPERSRILFMKRYFSFVPIKELARESGTSVRAVGMQLMRLREKLKEYLRKENVDL